MDPSVAEITFSDIDPAETETGLHGIERGDPAGLFRHADITLDSRLSTGADLADRRLDSRLRLLSESVETLVESGNELLLVPQFLG
ncbi:hypothetical protein [Streptomyces sp. NPDC051569]|uniref:hypothetical protein n=1 Tax=Streptomyces sp. NPDC051569 TaxID=3365661 RepID=UPI00379D94E0